MKGIYIKRGGRFGSWKHRVRNGRRGIFLIEATLSLVLLLAVSLIVFRVTVTTIRARQWGIAQSLADSYLTYEVAYASRIPYETFNVVGGEYPVADNVTTTAVEIGTLPGGTVVNGTVYRSRIADTNNGANTLDTESWKLRAILIYQFDGRTYAKSRTVARTR